MDYSISPEESQRLFAAARNGDESSLWRLTDGLRPYLKALVRKELGPELRGKVDDSDVVQQSLIRAANKFSDFHGNNIEGWQAWLVAITRNEARNTARYWHQQRRDAFRETNGQAVEHPQFQGALRDESTPSKAAIRREDAAQLLDLINQLPIEQQQIISWRFFENLSHKEVASRLGISEVASRQRAHQALLKLNALSNGSS